MTNILSVEDMRKSDALTIQNGTSGIELMKRAGIGILHAAPFRSPVAIVCGKGNNAGDGFVLATLLNDEHIDVTIYLLSDSFSPDGKYYYDECVKKGIQIREFTKDTEFKSYATIVDCLFGTGFKGAPEGIYLDAICAINESGAYVISADINSGLHGNSGMAIECVHSDLTVSIGSFKPGHFLNMAKDVMKKKINCDIGITPTDYSIALVDKKDIKNVFPKRKNLSNKSTYGYIGLLGGSECYSGAIRLAGIANCAMRSGAGVVMIATPRCISNIVAQNVLESTLYPLSDENGHLKFVKDEFDTYMKRVKVIAFGMGISLNEETDKALSYLLQNYTGTLIIDADGITSLSKMDESILDKAKCNIVLTPHNMEFSRLAGLPISEILESPVEYAKEYAKKHHITLLLKGPSTIVTDGTTVLLTDAGCAGMATAGSGDVLSGILAAICGFENDLLLATTAAAYINGKAGEMAESMSNTYSMTAGDTALCIAKTITEFFLEDL